MMQFWSHRYMLQPQAALSAVSDSKVRIGLLLKIQWPDQKIGYADLFPWQEFGDEPLESHIQGLKKGKISQLLEQSIWLGRKDAILRSQNKNALTDAMKIKNHFLISDYTQTTDAELNEAMKSGFTTIKVKVGRNWKEEIEWINKILRTHLFKCRLDFNSQGDIATFERMLSFLTPGLKQRIEYVEDPFPWNYDIWKDAAKIAPLALDQEFKNIDWTNFYAPVPFKTIIIKPARQDVEEAIRIATLKQLKIVVTSSLDHPVGVAHAVRIAAELKRRLTTQVLDCGCLTIRNYKPNIFSEQMTTQGPYLTQVTGTGIGFDDIFAKLKWEKIR